MESFIFLQGIICLNGCGDKCMFQFVNWYFILNS